MDANAEPDDADADDGEAEEHHDWFEDIALRVFVDGFVAQHWTLANGFQGDHAAQLPERAYDVLGGPTIAIMALDVTYAAQPIGATLSLRFGSAEYRWLGPYSGLPQGLQSLQQAFVTWLPVPELQIDFGEFTTPIGIEQPETFLNVTYTLGSLFQLLQPFYHAGLRLTWTPVSWFTLIALAVNGYNDVIDNNDGKTGALQGIFRFGPATLALAYMLGPEQAPDPMIAGVDARLRHLADVVLTLEGGPVRFVANASLRLEDMGAAWTTLYGPTFTPGPTGPKQQTLFGIAIGARVVALPELAFGGRVEYVGQPDLPASLGRDLITGTFTIDVLPVEHLSVRLDNRLDWLSGPLFPGPGQSGIAAGDPTATNQLAISTVLGVVVRSD